MSRVKDGALTDNQRAVLDAINFAPVSIGEAMRVGGYSCRSAARKALTKLKNMGLVDGYFGEAGNITPASFSITPEGRALISVEREKGEG